MGTIMETINYEKLTEEYIQFPLWRRFLIKELIDDGYSLNKAMDIARTMDGTLQHILSQTETRNG
jgi:hypothetical protein